MAAEMTAPDAAHEPGIDRVTKTLRGIEAGLRNLTRPVRAGLLFSLHAQGVAADEAANAEARAQLAAILNACSQEELLALAGFGQWLLIETTDRLNS